jgi:FK506-binding protein 15
MKLIHASNAHAYQYDAATRQYATKGKVGVAVLGNRETRKFQLLVYISTKEHITKASIDSKFTFTIQPNLYAAFYDEKTQSWSLRFDTADEQLLFAKNVAMAKGAAGNYEALVSQDLALGEGSTALTPGDSVEVRYTGWINQAGVEGKIFDSNMKKEKAFRFKLGKGKVIRGWDEGLVGMKKGGKRYLVVPAALAYGSQGLENVVPPNAVLNFEVRIRIIIRIRI